MSWFDNLKKSLAKNAAEQTAKQARQTASRAVEALADDFLDAAEGALDRARAEQGQKEALVKEEEDQTWSLHQERLDRKKRAVEELARLKAARDAED
jgi:hypothetical protein